MKEGVLQRIIDVFRTKSNSETQFAKMIGANQKTINQQFKKERSLSLDTVLGILSSFPDISAEWLLRGEGEMLKSDNKNINDNFDKSQYVSKNKYESKIYLLAEVTNDLKETVLENKKLRKEIEELRSQLETTKSA